MLSTIILFSVSYAVYTTRDFEGENSSSTLVGDEGFVLSVPAMASCGGTVAEVQENQCAAVRRLGPPRFLMRLHGVYFCRRRPFLPPPRSVLVCSTLGPRQGVPPNTTHRRTERRPGSCQVSPTNLVFSAVAIAGGPDGYPSTRRRALYLSRIRLWTSSTNKYNLVTCPTMFHKPNKGLGWLCLPTHEESSL